MDGKTWWKSLTLEQQIAYRTKKEAEGKPVYKPKAVSTKVTASRADYFSDEE